MPAPLPSNVLRTSGLPWISESKGGFAWASKGFDDLPLGGLGAHLERLSPNSTSAPLHFHHFEEEVFYLLEGSATLRQGDGQTEDLLVPVTAGDLCVFRPLSGGGSTRVPASGEGRPLAHQFINEGSEDLVFFAASERLTHGLCEYPERGTTYVHGLRAELRIQAGGYFEGEGAPARERVVPGAPTGHRERKRVGRDALPANVVPASSAPVKTWGEGRIGSSYQDLGDAGGAVMLGVSVTRVAPGRHSAPLHYHMADDELFYVLAGSGRLVQARVPAPVLGPTGVHPLGEHERVALEPGDVISFPPGSGLAHRFENDGPEDFVFLAVGTDRREDVCVYPESGKILLAANRALGWPHPVPRD